MVTPQPTKIKTVQCPHCGASENVLTYYAKVGGSDELVKQVHCIDLIGCMKRQLKQPQARTMSWNSRTGGKVERL